MYQYDRNSRFYMKGDDEHSSSNPKRSAFQPHNGSNSRSPLQDSNRPSSYDRSNPAIHNIRTHYNEPQRSQTRVLRDTQQRAISSDLGQLKGPGETKTRTQMARAFQESQELYKSADTRAGLQTVKTRRVLKKTTTITRGENEKFEDNSNFREKLLRWAQKTTEGYPGCRVVDLTTSWRDGLAYNAIIHRNRPDLLDYRSCRTKTSFENLDQAFTVGQRDLGIDRLLEPADVDRPNQDEKSMITYLAQLYELFPDPTDRNPLLDEEMIRRIDEYKELASRLLRWIKTSTSKLEDRKFPKSTAELRRLKDENERFLTDEVPPKQHDKKRLASVAREIYKMAQEIRCKIDNDLHIDNIDYHWDRMMNAYKSRSKALDDGIGKSEELKSLLDRLLNEINKTDGKLDLIGRNLDDEERRIARIRSTQDNLSPGQMQKLSEDLARVGIDIDNIKNMANDFVQEVGRSTPDTVMIGEKVADLDTKYKRFLAKLSQLHQQFEVSLKRVRDAEDAERRAAAKREAEAKLRLKLDEMRRRLDELERRIDSMGAVSNDLATLQNQLAELHEFDRDLNKVKVDLNDLIKLAEDMIRDELIVDPSRLRVDLQGLKDQLSRIEDKAARRLREFEESLKHAERQKTAEAELNLKLDDIRKRLDDMERRIDGMGPIGKNLASIQKQLDEMRQFDADLNQVRRNLNDIIRFGEDMIRDDLITDPTSLRANIRGLKDHLARIDEKAARRLRALQDGLNRAEAQQETEVKFNLRFDSLKRELSELESKLDTMAPVGKDLDALQKQLGEMNEFGKQLEKTRNKLNELIKAGEDLIREEMIAEPSTLRSNMKGLKEHFSKIEAKAAKRLRDIQDAMSRVAVSDRIQEVAQWLERAKRVLVGEENIFGDLDTVNALIEQHKSFQEELAERQPVIDEVRRMEQELSPQSGAIIRDQMTVLSNQWRDVERLMDEKTSRLDEALDAAEKLQNLIHNALGWYSEAEMKLRFGAPLPLDEVSAKQELTDHEKFCQRLANNVPDREPANKMAKEILTKCHPDAEPIIKQWINVMQSRHEEIDSWAKAKSEQLNDHLDSLLDLLKLVEELIDWLAKNELRLLSEESEPLPSNAKQLEAMISQHAEFVEELRSREPNVDKVIKVFASNSETATSKVVVTATTTKSRSSSDFRTSQGTLNSRTPTSFTSPSGRLSATGARSATPTRTSYATYKDEYPDVRQARAKLMLEKWRAVWQLALDKEQKLRDKSEQLKEMERMENFDFDQWRRRFLTWINSSKGRLMDFFRSIDDNNDGRIPIDAFVNGVMRSKFETSRLEMERVAEIFDRNNDGTIDNKEYLEALRPDKPITDDELIQDEVQRQVARCTCQQRYKVYHVGEGRYRFGESQKLRLVRILRSTVMVRVGGGWEPLHSFLQKNDPCRAKGRTNVELREQFILPEGASQAMAAFRSKMAKDPGSMPALGPITKIREKTDKSMPMSSTRYGSPSDYYSESESNKTRSRLGGHLTPASAAGSRPASRAASRPPSRYGSDQSSLGPATSRSTDNLH